MGYADMLANRMQEFGAEAWLLNTGWTGGGASSPEGKRINLKYTRAMVDAIHSFGAFDEVGFEKTALFGFKIPKTVPTVPGVPSKILNPRNVSKNVDEYDKTLAKLHG